MSPDGAVAPQPMNKAVWFAALLGIGGLITHGLVGALVERGFDQYVFVEEGEGISNIDAISGIIQANLGRFRETQDADVVALYGYAPDYKSHARLFVSQKEGTNLKWLLNEHAPTNTADRERILSAHQDYRCESSFLSELPKDSEFRGVFEIKGIDSKVTYPIFKRADRREGGVLVGYISWQTLLPTAETIGRPQGDWAASVCGKLANIADSFAWLLVDHMMATFEGKADG